MPILPHGHDDLFAGDRYIAQFMDKIIEASKCFPTAPQRFVICAASKGKYMLPDQPKLMIKKLKEAGKRVNTREEWKYDASYSHTPEFADRGLVFVDGGGEELKVWLENRCISCSFKDDLMKAKGQNAAASDGKATYSADSLERFSQWPKLPVFEVPLLDSEDTIKGWQSPKACMIDCVIPEK